MYMPRDLFGDVTDPSVRVGSRKWYTVPLSLAVHSLVVLVIIIVPLLAAGTLPLPRSAVMFVPIVERPLPPPPEVRRSESDTPPPTKRDAAPLVAPSTIEKEPDFAAGFESALPGVSEIPGGAVIDGGGVLPAPPVAPPPAPQKTVRVGGHISAPQKVHDVAPVYPPIAQAAGVQGIVILECLIAQDGSVQDARVLRSAPLLDQAALAAVRQWVYQPTLLNGVPVSVIMTVTVRFELRR
jgi:periplasmic protein TonB